MALANPERGEVSMDIAGTTYTLKLSMNAAVALERKLKKRIGQLLAEVNALGLDATRTMVWLLLQKHHAADFKTEDAVGNLIDDAGGIQAFFETLKALFEANAPETAAGADGQPPNPPDAQAGTADAST